MLMRVAPIWPATPYAMGSRTSGPTFSKLCLSIYHLAPMSLKSSALWTSLVTSL